MRVIIIDNIAYKITEREYYRISEMADRVAKANYPEGDQLLDDLYAYIEDAKPMYPRAGRIEFTFNTKRNYDDLR